MKTLVVIVVAALFGVAGARADEKHEHAAGPGLFGQPSEYVHVLLNPLPVYGLAIGILALGAALVARSQSARAIALGIIIVSSAAAWPVQYYGENAYQRVRQISDEHGQHWLDEHMGRAQKLAYFFYGTAAFGIAGLISQKKFPQAVLPLTIATLFASGISLGIGGWIGNAGGQIRHPEFRGKSPASTNAASPEHGVPEQSHEKMQPAKAADDHEQGTTSQEGPGKIPMPDTVEGIWKAISAYHGELKSAVSTNDFVEVQSDAKTIGTLAKRLVDVAPADRKPVVESGVTKINQAVDELRSSAETGSDSVMKMRLKEFEKVLEQLEQQMKKQ